MSAHFFCIVLDLSSPLVLVIFDNPSTRKRVSCKSKGLKFRTFSACVVDFVPSSFLSDFFSFLRPFEAPFGTNFEETTIPKIASKKEAPLLESSPLSSCPMAPRDAASYYSL